MSTFIVMTGNAVDGLEMIGPFSTAEDAGGYAEDCVKNEVWHIVEIQQPYQQIPFVMDAGQIDFEMLREQKSILAEMLPAPGRTEKGDRIGYAISGVLELLDELMDRAADSAGNDDVFGKSDE